MGQETTDKIISIIDKLADSNLKAQKQIRLLTGLVEQLTIKVTELEKKTQYLRPV